MPRYGYGCGTCGSEYVLFRAMESRVLDRCVACGTVGEYRPLLTTAHAPYVQSAWVDNHAFNNGAGKVNEGLGVETRTRQQERDVMEAKGLAHASDYGDFHGPQSLTRKPKPAPDPAIMLDALNKAEHMVKNNLVPPPTPLPEQTRDLLQEGYETV